MHKISFNKTSKKTPKTSSPTLLFGSFHAYKVLLSDYEKP
ncbi:hypothetical protein HMPREF9151_00636 [Hoylesella saccharolytica F0055]|uniref:Uncharacterized protein n=1 Tax=Hoylesella saccharolytica F0055 TaxID=1127699 RepID=L1NHV7_9BACT|nr:hypothetical protein HMPREF9151_00636 [Hoylesella saccharolytica F0055]